MRILIIISSLTTAGAEYALLRQIKDLRKIDKNISFAIISIISGGLFEEFKNLNIPIFILKKEIQSKFKFLYRFNNFVKNFDPDLIHSWMYHANLISYLVKIIYRKKLIISIRQALPNYKCLKLQTLIVAYLDSLLSTCFANKIIFNCQSGLEDHCNLLFYSREKSEVIYNKPKILPYKKINDNDKSIKFLNLSRNDRSKNLYYMINLINKLDDTPYKIQLDIYGIAISKLKTYIKKINQYNPKVSINAYNFKDNISEILSRYQIYLSTSFWEGYPNSLVTASSSGLIPVFSNAGDSKLILGKFGFTLNLEYEHDLGELKKSINYSFSKSQEKRSKEVISFLNDFPDSIKQYKDLYMDLIEKIE